MKKRAQKWFDLAPLVVAFMLAAGIVSRAGAAAVSINHSPALPRAGQPVKVSVSLPELEEAILQVQFVAPGSYIRKSDPEYRTSWRDFPMEKHGASFIVRVPGELQRHRALVRYRIKGTSNGRSVTYPSATDAAPNYCWFVYDGFPQWKGSSRPGRPPELIFTPEFLATLPTYHLIARAEDVKDSQWNHQANRKPFSGTLIYDGKVYDHITFHNRGQASTYVSGKNKWGIKFNKGEEFGPRDNYGEPYKYEWSGFNLNPCASAWAQVNRGMAGMDEALSYRVYQLAGVPSPDTFWIHFRVIDEANENSSNQFNTDLWGLYLVVQEKNGTWLRENKLPDGNIFSIDSGPKHLGLPEKAAEQFQQARSGSHRKQSEQWWRANLDLPAYYSFHALNRYVANIDLRPDGNHYLYFRPDGRAVILPHDLDMMLLPKHHQPGFVMQSRCLDVPALKLEYQARAREILDLLASDARANGGQIGQLVAELSSHLKPRGHKENWAQLDEAMWNWHPRSQHKGQFNVTPYDDHRMGGHWERTLATPDFAGFCKYILDFCTDTRPEKNFRPNDGDPSGYGYGYLAYEARDNAIPRTPKIRFAGGEGFDAGKLSFVASVFSSPTGAEAASIQWRVGEISAPGVKGYEPGKPMKYEIETVWAAEFPATTPTVRIPGNVCAAGRTYRVRARFQDETGRWGHWSAPAQFTAAD